MANVLVTGADGFVGRRCVAALAQRGHEVVSTDRQGSVTFTGDLSSAAFCASLPDVDVVVHSAAVQYVSRDLPLWRRQAYFESNNVEATRQLVGRYKGSAVHFVNIATSMMYRSRDDGVYRPDSPLEGQGVYSRSKLTAMGLVESSGLACASVVPCIIGGPGREGLFRGFVSSMLRLRMVAFPGEGRHPVNMVHVDDVADLLVQVVETRALGRFNAAAPRPLSINQWVAEIADELRRPLPRIIRLPLGPLRALSAASGYRLLAREQLLMLAHPHVLDISASEAIGWQPRHDNARIARDIGRYIADSL